MSYIQSRIRCNHCKLEMNVAFGIINSSIIAQWPERCPTCGLGQFTKIADGWQADPVQSSSPSQADRKEK